MKKFLSLVLALVMTMSLVTISAGATSFPDDASITYKEAVEVMADLGILSGYADGSFKPQGTLTRGAAAKIIAYISLGTKNAELLTASKNDLPADVAATSSVAPYIAYCFGNGIVSGYSNGNFGPKDTVSGYAFIKMALGALDVKGEFTGAGWQLRAAKAAEEIGLLNGIDTNKVSFAVNATRELACQIAFNAMFANPDLEVKGYQISVIAGSNYAAQLSALVEDVFATRSEALVFVNSAVAGATVGTDYTIAPYYGDTVKGTLAGDNFGIEAFTGIVIANQYTGAKYTKIVEATINLEDGTVDGYAAINEAVEFDIATDDAALGQLVTVYKAIEMPEDAEDGDAWPVSALAVKSTNVKNGSTIAKNANYPSKDAALKQIETTFGKTVVPAQAVLTLSAVSGQNFVPGFASMSYDAENEFYTFNKFNKATPSVSSGNFVVYNGEIVAYTTLLTRALVEVTEVVTTKNAETITLRNVGTINNGKIITVNGEKVVSDMIDEYDGIAEGDYAVAIWAGDKVYLEKAESVTGVPTKIDTTATGNARVTIGGKTYQVSSMYTNLTTLTNPSTGIPNMNLTDEVRVFVYGGKYAFATTTPAGAAANATYVVCVYSIETTFEDQPKNEYGDPIEGAQNYTTYYAQTVNAAGEIVVMQITKNQHDNFAGRGLYSYTVAAAEDAQNKDAFNKNMVANYATFAGTTEDVLFDTFTVTAAEGLKADAKTLTTKTYFASDVKFVYLNADENGNAASKGDLTVTVKSGVQVLAQNTEVSYIYENADETSGNKVVKVVFIDAQTEPTVYTGDVIYVGANVGGAAYPVFTVGTYVDAQGVTQTTFQHTVYVNGELTTIITNSSTALEIGEFYKAEAVIGAEGVFSTEKMDNEDGAYTNLTIDNIYAGMLTVDAVAAIDNLAIGEAKIIDLRDADLEANLNESGEFVAVETAADLQIGMIIDVMLGQDVNEQFYIAYIFVNNAA